MAKKKMCPLEALFLRVAEGWALETMSRTK